MASRQNREARPEYPTGHNKGNDSPNRDVPGTNGGRNYGGPMGVQEPRDDIEERRRLLDQKPAPGVASELIEQHVAEGIEETEAIDRAQADENRRTEAGTTENPTRDLTWKGARDKIEADKVRTEEEIERQSR